MLKLVAADPAPSVDWLCGANLARMRLLAILGRATRVFGRQAVLVTNVGPSMLHPIYLRVIGVRKAVWLSGAPIVPVPSRARSPIVTDAMTNLVLWLVIIAVSSVALIGHMRHVSALIVRAWSTFVAIARL
jgi:hypothetical protein